MGRLELFHSNIWGTVCSTQFHEIDAVVICRQLGYPKLSSYGLQFGPGSGRIWIPEILCQGHEHNLLSCHFAWGSSGCDHDDDVGVVCEDGMLIIFLIKYKLI